MIDKPDYAEPEVAPQYPDYEAAWPHITLRVVGDVRP
jgi:hypothetical protein